MAKRSIEYNFENVDKIFRALSYEERIKATRGALKNLARRVRMVAVADAAGAISSASTLSGRTWHNAAQIADTIRGYAFKGMFGLQVSVMWGKRKKGISGSNTGFYRNKKNKEKPVALWANVGTNERKTRRTERALGSTPAMRFMEQSQPKILAFANAEMQDILMAYLAKAAKKNGAQFN